MFEKLKTIEKELGGESDEGREIKQLRVKIKKLNMPAETEKKIIKEVRTIVMIQSK